MDNLKGKSASHSRLVIVLRLLLAACSLHLFLCVSVRAEEMCTIYFYNPESNINNFSALKSNMDRYLKKFRCLRFQPFNDRAIFDRHLQKGVDGVVILSSSHYREIRDKVDIVPVMVGVSDGNTGYRKVLVAGPAIKSARSLNGITVATSGSDAYTIAMLLEMFGEEQADIIGSFRLLAVPKDIDAIIAVGFGMADTALTTERGIDMLQTLNPGLHEELVVVARSNRLLRPIVAAPSEHRGEIGALLTALRGMGGANGDSRGMQMIGLDGWVEIYDEDELLLNR